MTATAWTEAKGQPGVRWATVKDARGATHRRVRHAGGRFAVYAWRRGKRGKWVTLGKGTLEQAAHVACLPWLILERPALWFQRVRGKSGGEG
jgi:hypothetical protein